MEFPGYRCEDEEEKRKGISEPDAIEIYGKSNITLQEAKYLCSKDSNCTQFFSTIDSSYLELIQNSKSVAYFKCNRNSIKAPYKSISALYVKGIT